MNTPTALPPRRPPGFRPAHPLRLRAELPAIGTRPRVIVPATAGHDFLVPNPRPDLTMDLNTLRMLEAG